MATGTGIDRRVLGLMALGFALRLGLAIALGINNPPKPGTDQEEYDTYAWNVAQGRGYRGMTPDVSDKDHLTAYRPPLPSLTWAAVYSVFGHRYAAVRVMHCLIGASLIGLVYGLGRACFGERVGLLSAVAMTFYPHALLFSVELLSESLATALLLGYLLACLSFAKRPTWGLAALAGVLLGLGLLSRPATLFLIPITLVWAAYQFLRDRPSLIKSLAIPVVGGLCLLPWVVRNYLVFERVIPFSTMGGSVLLQGNNRIVHDDPLYRGYSVWDTDLAEYREALIAPNDEVLRDEVAGKLGKEWIRANLGKLPIMAYWKLKRGFTPILQPHTPALYRYGTLLSWGPVLVLFLVGAPVTLVRLLREGHPGWLIHASLLSFVATTVIFFGNARYRFPFEPICIILAAYAIEWMWRSARGRSGTSSSSQATAAAA